MGPLSTPYRVAPGSVKSGAAAPTASSGAGAAGCCARAPGAASAVTSGATTAYEKRFMWHPPLFVAPLKLGGTRAQRQGASGSGASVPDRPVIDVQDRQALEMGRESPREVGEIPPRDRKSTRLNSSHL